MSTATTGDLVRLKPIRGNGPKVKGYVSQSYPTFVQIMGLGNTHFQFTEFDLEIIRSAPPLLLPTIQGYYASGTTRHSDGVLQRTRTGEWWWVGNFYQPSPERLTDVEVGAHLPLTRLVLEEALPF